MSIWQPFRDGELIRIESMYSLFQYHYHKGYCFNGAHDLFWECVYVLEGTIHASGDERIYDLTPGRIIFHKPMELHKFSVTSDGGARLMIFTFTLTGQAASNLKNRVFTLDAEQQQLLSGILDYAASKSAQISIPPELSYSQRWLAPAAHSPFYLQRIACDLHRLFLSLADSGSITESLSTPETELYRKAVRYMLSHLNCQLSVSDISRYCSVSDSSLKRVFAKYAGMSVHRYFLILRLNAAAEMLQTGKTITEVADTLNFSSQSYFSVSFRREMGISPSEYKSGAPLPASPSGHLLLQESELI